MVCVSIILAHMLASLDCVSRQECWEPLLPKHLQHVFYHHREDNHWSIDVRTNWQQSVRSTNEQRPPESWSMTWRRHPPLSTTCCHMINKKELVSSHHQPTQTWQSLPPKVFQVKYMMSTIAGHMFTFLSLSDSKKVCTGVTIDLTSRIRSTATSNNLWVLTCLHVMKTFNKNWCWLTHLIKVHPSPWNLPGTSIVTTIINKQRSHPPCSSRNDCHNWTPILFQGQDELNWTKEGVFRYLEG